MWVLRMCPCIGLLARSYGVRIIRFFRIWAHESSDDSEPGIGVVMVRGLGAGMTR